MTGRVALAQEKARLHGMIDSLRTKIDLSKASYGAGGRGTSLNEFGKNRRELDALRARLRSVDVQLTELKESSSRVLPELFMDYARKELAPEVFEKILAAAQKAGGAT